MRPITEKITWPTSPIKTSFLLKFRDNVGARLNYLSGLTTERQPLDKLNLACDLQESLLASDQQWSIYDFSLIARNTILGTVESR